MIPPLFVLFCAAFAPAGGDRSHTGIAGGYRKISAGRIAVFYQAPDGKVARRYLEWARAYVPRPDFLGKESLGELKVFIAPSDREFDRLSVDGPARRRMRSTRTSSAVATRSR